MFKKSSQLFKKNISYFFAITFLSLFFLISCSNDKKNDSIANEDIKLKEKKKIKLSLTYIEFSTNVTISVYDIEKKDKLKISNLLASTQNVFQYFENEMNPINEKSTLYKFNNKLRNQVNKFHKIPRSLLKLIQESNRIYKISDKKFDIAVFPIMDLWGFSSEKEPRIPKPIEIKNLLENITMKNVVLKEDSLMFLNNSVEIGLGAIAKGFAVDSVASYLKSSNIHDFIIEAGGDLTVSSKSSRTKKIGVRNPRVKGALLDTLSVLNGSIATSGDYEKFIIDKIADNKRYCHIINPLTGYSDSDCISVTILAENAYLADAYATAVFLLGSENGEKFILENNLKGIIITKDMNLDNIKDIKYINLDKKETIQ